MYVDYNACYAASCNGHSNCDHFHNFIPVQIVHFFAQIVFIKYFILSIWYFYYSMDSIMIPYSGLSIPFINLRVYCIHLTAIRKEIR